MDLDQSLGGASELFEAQTHIYRHSVNYINSMVLGCALELGIPDIIHNHQKPITLQELVSKLNISVEKTLHLQRLMRLLIHQNFFSVTKFHDKEGEDEKEGYILTVSSKLLLKNSSSPTLPNLLPFVNLMVDHVYVTTFESLGRWFKGNELNAFATAHGTHIWEFADKNPRFNTLFNDAMASNSEMMKLVVKENKELFEGVDSLVDVGGGNGANAKIILEAFPHLNCTVFELPHVVADMVDTKNLKYIGGDMFQSIPSADAIILKNILHDWKDEEALKILERCDMNDHERHEITEAKLFFDLKMMALATGKERTKDEWGKLFLQANINQYKITHVSGLMSIIELFP
ncbi:hypothetical protein L2E82_39991 [Cichorium intybus]|uniref:Uncharacterized protein n=2 Tax=Cichorium intybus TaxID=13427 RepID=A0ACB9AP45_CICIN|nr:hypothetical protein L2E82_39989 [Cichorium intybus]KAI3710217.1 hypothetical protein L2E82_39991 [Cichorium intybus]